MTAARVVLSGCSGGGKSTLLAELASRGVPTFVEPGREVVRAALAGTGGAFPDRDPLGFAAACLERGRTDLRRADTLDRPAVFDRCEVDVLTWLEHRGLPLPAPLAETVAAARLHQVVLFAPPWPEIYAQDEERRHSFETALADHDRLRRDYVRLGFELLTLPRATPAERADWVLRAHPAFAT